MCNGLYCMTIELSRETSELRVDALCPHCPDALLTRLRAVYERRDAPHSTASLCGANYYSSTDRKLVQSAAAQSAEKHCQAKRYLGSCHQVQARETGA